jgi:hypothetical protein
MNKFNQDIDISEDQDSESESRSFRIPLNWFQDPANCVGDERVARYVHNFKIQRYFGAKGTLLQCRFVHEAYLTMPKAELECFCTEIGFAETSPTFRFLLETGERFSQLQQANYWSTDWLALYFLWPPHDQDDFERLLRIGKLFECKSADVIRDALVHAATCESARSNSI